MAFTKGVGPTSNTGAATTSVAVTLVGTTAGRGIVIGVLWNGSTITISNITISGESNATVHGSPIGNNLNGQIASLSNNTGGGDKTITCTLSGSCDPEIVAMEVIGGDTSGMFSAANKANGGSDLTATVSLTTLTANEMIFAVCMNTDQHTSAGSGYTLITLGNPAFYNDGEYKLDAGATGAKTVDMTLPVGGFWGISAASFKLGSSGSSSALGGSASTSAQQTIPTIGLSIGL